MRRAPSDRSPARARAQPAGRRAGPVRARTHGHGRRPGYAGVIMSSEPAPLPPSPLDTWPPAWSPSAVVFDFDGLLVDTEAEWIRVQDAYLAMHDVRMDAATRREITGR